MADVSFKSAAVGNLDPGALARGFVIMGQPAQPTAEGVVISPRAGGASWLRYHGLAERGFDPTTFTQAFASIDRRVNPNTRLEALGRPPARDAVRRWLDAGDFGQLTYKLLETSSPDERHLWLREIVLPVFFEAFPGGRLACVTYSQVANRYLAFLNTLKKMNVLNAADKDVLERHVGKFAMSSFQLNVPAELIWLMLSFSSIAFFPESYVFIASCEHLYFLVFITDRPVSTSQGEERYGPIERLMPKIISVLDSVPKRTPLFVGDKFVHPSRGYPFNRRNYNDAAAMEDFLRAYVANLNELLCWICDATNFVTADGQFDLDFALQTYLTIYVLLNTTYRLTVEQVDMFARKMALFDVLELYAALVDSKNGQTAAWKAHLRCAFRAKIITVLGRYPAPFGQDFVEAVRSLLSNNDTVVKEGLLYGQNADGTVTVPNQGPVPFEEFMVSLLRSLRNTKHGFAIHGEDYLAVHTGDLSNDLPDFALALWLNFMADRSAYTLVH